MAFYPFLSGKAQKQLAKIPAAVARTIISALREACERDHPLTDPFVRKLAGRTPPEYRLRVGDYRVVFHIDGDAVRVTAVFHRQKGY